ncbi:hypothetical protein EW145_g1900 [Phellinidium pouzarii]|uniref:Uncharacterized protein n=1 Tax=Phellinidium pouzarii TaxID=167371 RepID=A0A4S4LEI2_9AGAM|nr:hypothetical protein EW145_g1900 [Phellinidium pouzarii]
MSSVVRSPQPTQPSKQWWSSNMPYRPSKSPISSPSTPAATMTPHNDEKSLRASSKAPTKKFNTLASVMGFKSKKNHPTINIPSGPVSPPLPFQNPPASQAPSSPSSARPRRYSSSYRNDTMSPGEPSIYTIPSSEEAFEPITPSDQLSRHRSSYQPSLFTFSEQQDYSTHMRPGDNIIPRYLPDTRRISVMSDPSIIDPHILREHTIRSSRVSGSSYYPIPSDAKAFPGKSSKGLAVHRDSLEKRKSSGESRVSREIDLSLNVDAGGGRLGSSGLRPIDHRYSDTGIPAVPKMSHLFTSVQRPDLRKSPSANAFMMGESRSRSKPRTGSPASIGSRSEKGTVGASLADEEHAGRDRVTSLRNSGSPRRDSLPLSHIKSDLNARPKAASVSNGSLNGSNTSGRDNGRPMPSIVTSLSGSSMSLSRTTSSTSGTGSTSGSVVGSIRRQPSMSRIRAVPPFRTPPPMSNLPPTPGSRPHSPLTFRSPRNASTSSLLNSAYPVTVEDPSILSMDLPYSESSSESGSSISLCFANSSQTSFHNDKNRDVVSSTRSSWHGSRDSHQSATNTGRMHREGLRTQRPTAHVTHGAKSSTSSSHTMRNTLGARGETPMQRSMKKCASQQSISANIAIRGERQRVDSEASIGSTALMSDEGNSSTFGSVGKSLRKQRSMHNTRVPGGSLALPPLPQQLRHANSFNVSSAFGEVLTNVQSSHTKNDSIGSNTGPSSTISKFCHVYVDICVELDYASSGSYLTDAQQNDRKKVHSIGLGLFSGHFSPSKSASHASENVYALRRVHSPPMGDFSVQHPHSPQSTAPPLNIFDQHILPPKELLSQMEALADTEAPPSPFADGALESDLEDEWSWDGSSVVATDKQGVRSRMNSVSNTSATFGWPDEGSNNAGFDASSPTLATTRRFISATGSIHGLLQNDRPSTASRLPTRNVSKLPSDSTSSNMRPSTAEPLNPVRGAFSNTPVDSYVAPTALPPPPRRKGTAVSSIDYFEDDEQIDSPPPLSTTHSSTRLQRLPSYENTCLYRLPSHETITAYNPNRGSIFRKPSFLDISDSSGDTANNIRSMSSVHEDSFLILEHGKDSLDIGRAFDELSDRI